VCAIYQQGIIEEIMRIFFRKFRLIKRVRRVKRRTKRTQTGRGDYLKYKSTARALVLSRLEYFNQFYNFKYNSVRIKNQKTRWGSCSKKGNLNFSYKLALLSPWQADYIIVHELCHLGEFNHSQKFWALVAQTIPDYKKIRQELKRVNLRKAGSVRNPGSESIDIS
jgi:predicted metal-dependent hydrolase